jgi:hypothetical protein
MAEAAIQVNARPGAHFTLSGQIETRDALRGLGKKRLVIDNSG